MLRLLTEQLFILLHPERVVIIHNVGFLRRKNAQVRHSFNLKMNEESSTHESLMQALENILQKPEWRGLRTHVIISSRYIKYRVAEWNDALSYNDQTAFLSNQFEEIYGEKAREWQVFIGITGFRKNELACAVDSNFLRMIQDQFQVSPKQLSTIQPYLIFAVNQLSQKIRGPAWLIVVEDGLIHFARLSYTGWKSIHSRVIENPIEQIPIFFEREEMLVEDGEVIDTMYLYWPEAPSYRPVLNSNIKIELLASEELTEFA